VNLKLYSSSLLYSLIEQCELSAGALRGCKLLLNHVKSCVLGFFCVVVVCVHSSIPPKSDIYNFFITTGIRV
jgi:hypothetical protein